MAPITQPNTREYLRQYFTYGQAVVVDFEIIKSGNYRFNGNDTLDSHDTSDFPSSPILYNHPKEHEYLQFPVNFETGTTLLKPLCIEGQPEYVFDESDHLWYPDNLRQYGYCVGSKIKMMGHVTKYKRKDGSIDFSLQPDSVMIHR